MQIRKAEAADIKELLEIYNYEVINSVSTLDLEPKTLQDWQAWFQSHSTKHHPLYVAEEERHIAGYASFSPYRDKEAYQSTVELSVYIGPKDRGKGMAAALMEYILKKAEEDFQIHMVISVITAGNEASRRLHEKFGFTYCGTIREVGKKFGAYQDIENYQWTKNPEKKDKNF